jgi:methionyl aminopeptidase
MSISNDAERQGIRHVGRAVAAALAVMRGAVRRGVTTKTLDEIAEAALAARGARSAPREVYGFPACICISVNEEIVHGIPRERALAAGDVVKLDVTAVCDGFIADAAETVLVEPVPARVRRLRDCAKLAFDDAASVARAGARVNTIGRAVEARTRAEGFAVVRELCGHGVGRAIHEDPQVLNYFDPAQTDVLTDGLVITIEPLLSVRPARAITRHDGWTIATANGSLAVHHEHTLIVGRDGAEIVTRL